MELLDKVKYWALGLSLLAAFKFYNKDNAETQIHAHFIEACSKDSACEEIVEANFDTCFETNYNIGVGKRKSTFDQKAFASCFKTESGENLFGTAH